MKKSGPTIDNFLGKMQQQMGVAMVGFAAYRDDEGKLCTFEYVTPSPGPTLITEADPFIASALRMIGRTPSFKHILRMLKSFLENGGNGLHKRVILVEFCSVLPTYLVMLLSGVGSTKPNQREDGEDEEPEELGNEAWMKLLDDDDGVLSLKPWEEVTAAKANKINIALALREVMRRTWGEYFFYYQFPHLTLVI